MNIIKYVVGIFFALLLNLLKINLQLVKKNLGYVFSLEFIQSLHIFGYTQYIPGEY